MKSWIKSHEGLCIFLFAIIFVVVVYGSLFIYLDRRHDEYMASHPDETMEVADTFEAEEYDEAVENYARWRYYQNFVLWR